MGAGGFELLLELLTALSAMFFGLRLTARFLPGTNCRSSSIQRISVASPELRIRYKGLPD